MCDNIVRFHFLLSSQIFSLFHRHSFFLSGLTRLLLHCIVTVTIRTHTGASFSDAFVLYGEGEGLILLDNVECTGDEINILECPGQDPGSNDCTHDEDIGIICRRECMKLNKQQQQQQH